jgi:hypothetical protein
LIGPLLKEKKRSFEKLQKRYIVDKYRLQEELRAKDTG